MKCQGALIKEQGVTFGILVVKPQVLHCSSDATAMRRLGTRIFGMVPIVLMAQNTIGIPTYYGRKDIVHFLSKLPLRAIPWKEYTIS